MASILHAGIGVAVVVLCGRQLVREARPPIDVTFVEKVVKPEPAAPPPDVAPQPPAAAPAPVVRPEQTARKLDVAPKPKKLVAPRAMPKDTPKEAEPKDDSGVASLGDSSKRDAAGLEGGTDGGVVGGVAGGAIQLPDDAIPPRPMPTNRVPAYPEAARADGRTGAVVLEIVVLANGSVGPIRVVRGDEPFATAAIDAVKSWRYEPARYKGLPISVYRKFQVTFRLMG